MTFISSCCGVIMNNIDWKHCPSCGRECEVVDESIYDSYKELFKPDYPSLDELTHGDEL